MPLFVVVQSPKLCPALCDPMDCSTPGFPVLHYLPGLAQTHVHWVRDGLNRLILCHPLLLCPSIFPSIMVFSNELALRVRWWKHWSFSISPSNEYSGLIPFKIDLISLLSKGLWRVFSSTTIQRHPFFGWLMYNTAMLLGYVTVPLTLHRQTETPH